MPRTAAISGRSTPSGPRERDKLAYGHAFVLLAASSAKCAGHPDADRLLADVSEVLETRFWEAGVGASAEEFREDWSTFSAPIAARIPTCI